MTGKNVICGLDEAGRGALAGPLVAAAVILPRQPRFRLRDSKKLSAIQRRTIYGKLKRMKAAIAVEVISARSINNHGIGWANREIMRRLIKKLYADEYIVDGNMKIGRVAKKKIISIPHADARIPEVMAAGIVAKVERDHIMRGLHRQFPRYRWRENAGYGTRTHVLAIREFSVTRYHRGVYVTTALRHYSAAAEA